MLSCKDVKLWDHHCQQIRKEIIKRQSESMKIDFLSWEYICSTLLTTAKMTPRKTQVILQPLNWVAQYDPIWDNLSSSSINEGILAIGSLCWESQVMDAAFKECRSSTVASSNRSPLEYTREPQKRLMAMTNIGHDNHSRLYKIGLRIRDRRFRPWSLRSQRLRNLIKNKVWVFICSIADAKGGLRVWTYQV